MATRTSRLGRSTPTGVGPVEFGYGTSSDETGADFQEPQDIGDIASLEREIGGRQGSTPRRPPMGGIDLGKGLDLEKPRAPRSGIGLEIGKSPQGNLGVGVEVPIGLSPFGARGGVSIDPATGKIRGGYGGLGIGKGPIGASVDVGVDTPAGSENFGCFKYVTFSAGPFSHTYGKNECEPKEQEKPKPPGANLPPGALSPNQIDEAMLTTSCGTVCVTWVNFFDTDWENPYPTGREGICYRSRPVYNGYAYTGAFVTSWASEYDYYIDIGEDIYGSLS